MNLDISCNLRNIGVLNRVRAYEHALVYSANRHKEVEGVEERKRERDFDRRGQEFIK